MEISPHRDEDNYCKPILKKNITTPEDGKDKAMEFYHKSQSFTIGEAGDVDQIMKKQLSFNLDPQVEPENKRKSSRAIIKEEKDKRQSIKNKDFIPLRDSQINTLWFQEKPQKNNQDDFNFESLRVPSIDFDQPKMKRRGNSHKVSNTFHNESLDNEDGDLLKTHSDEIQYLKMNKKYISDKNKIIYERQSEDVVSSHQSDSVSNKKSNKNDLQIDTLFLPNVDSEAQRKRVKSWRKGDDEEKINFNDYIKKKSEEVNDDPYFQDDPNVE